MRKKSILLIMLSALLIFSNIALFAETGMPLWERFGYASSDDYQLFDNVEVTYYDKNGNVITDLSKITIDTKLDLEFGFVLEKAKVNKIKAGDYYETSLPAGLVVSNEVLSQAMSEFATYSITSDNKIRIDFTKDMGTYGDMSGGVLAEAEFDKDSIQSPGTIEVKYPVKESIVQNITINPRNTAVSIDKKVVNESGSAVTSLPKNTKEVSWSVVANKNVQPLEGVSISDVLPAGMSYKEDSLVVELVNVDFDGNVLSTPGKVLEEGKDFEFVLKENTVDDEKIYTIDVEFKNDVDGAIRLSYRTLISDEWIDKQSKVETQQTFKNDATMTYNTDKSISTDATVDITYSGYLSKTGKVNPNNPRQILWTVEFNSRNKTISNALLTDIFSSDLNFLTNSLVVKTKAGNTTLTVGDDYTVDYTNEETGNSQIKIKFNNTINETYVITYTTELKEGKTVSSSQKYENSISYEDVTTGGNATLTQQAIDKTVDSSKINYVDKTIPWTILLNKNSQALSNLILTDDFKYNGLLLKEETLVITNTANNQVLAKGTDYTLSGPEEGYDFKIVFIGNYANVNVPLKVEFITEFDYDYLTKTDGNKNSNLYDSNGVKLSTHLFVNEASLQWTYMGETYNSKDSASTPIRDEASNNGAKYGSYNAKTKLITWTTNINYNAETTDNPYVEDEILGNQVFVDDSLQIWEYTVASNGTISRTNQIDLDQAEASGFTIQYPNAENNYTLRIGLPTGGFQKYEIEYQTSLQDAMIQTEYLNTAKFHNGSVVRSLEAKVSIKYGGSLLTKSGVQNGSNVDWEVVINRSQSTLENVLLVDTPSANQIVDRDSFVIYPVTINVDGSYTVDKGHPLVLGEDYTITFKKNAAGVDIFELLMKGKIQSTYVLNYSSQIFTTPGNLEIKNNIEMTGYEIKKEIDGEQKPVKIEVSKIKGWINAEPSSLKRMKVGENGLPLSGVTFALYTSSDNLVGTQTTGSDGMISFDGLPGGTYILKEVSTANGYVISDEYYKGIVVNIPEADLPDGSIREITNVMNQLEIRKENTSGTLLDGSIFTLERLVGEDYALVSANIEVENGKVVLQGLDAGAYRLTETQAPEGYILNTKPTEFTIDVDGNGQELNKVVTIINEKGIAKLTKTDESNAPLEGVYYDLQNSAGVIVEPDLITDAHGVITYSGLVPGDYQWVEKSTVNGNIVNSNPIPFTISATSSGPVTAVERTAVNKKAKIQLTKTDKNLQPIKGATFELVNDQGQTIQTIQSGDSGEVIFSDVVPGHYTVVETQARSGYIRNTLNRAVTIDLSSAQEDYVVDLGNFVNEQGSVRLTKVSDLSEPIQGVVYRLESDKLSSPVEYTTDVSGQIVVGGLVPGSYQFIEVSAPEGYVVDPTPIPFVVLAESEGNASIIELNATNKKAQITFNKTNESQTPLEGSLFGLYDKKTSLLVQTATSKADGTVVFYRVGAGDYDIKEINATTGYVLNLETLSVSVPESASEAVEIDLGSFVNYQGQVKLIKTNDEQKRLEGVVFELYDQDSKLMSEYTTNQEGEIIVDKLAPGNYSWIEKTSVDGYVVDSTPITFTIVDQALQKPETIVLNVTNSYGKIQLTKVDKQENPLKDVVFGLYLKGSDEALQVKSSNVFGVVEFERVAVGEYSVREITPLAGYILDLNEYPVSIASAAVGSVTIDLGHIVNYQGTVEISKVDIQGNLLKEATFDLYNTTTHQWIRDVKTVDGQVTLSHLTPGSYEIHEVTAPVGYAKLNEIVEFEIQMESNGKPETVKINVVNHEIGKIINTGVGLNQGPFWLMIIGAVIVIGTGFTKRKKH